MRCGVWSFSIPPIAIRLRWVVHPIKSGLSGRALGGEGGAAGSHDGLKLHELDAGPVGIVEVGLPFAVFAHLGAVVAGAEAVFAVKSRYSLLHVGNADREVIHDAELAGIDFVG